MKNLIAKLRNRRLKGNVSLLVIFILLASSVIALLSINQIQRLLTYGNMTFNYFRAFYLAKAGTELGLTEVYYREAGFEQTINSGGAIVTENFGIYTGFNTHFTMNISGNFQNLTNDVRYTDNCNEDNKITLGSGEGIMLSLFRDKTTGFDKIFNEKSVITPLNDATEIKKLNMDYNGEGLMFGLFSYDGDLTNLDMGDNIFVKDSSNIMTLKEFLTKYIGDTKGERRYLTIKNSSNSDISFCINMNGGFVPYSNSLITVRGNYGDMEVGLQSVVEKEVPFWAMDVLGL